MNKTVISLLFAVNAILSLSSAADADLKWQCGANTRIEGRFLIAEVPQGEEKTGGVASAEVDLSEWDGKPVGASIVARGAGIAKPLNWYNGLKFQFEYVDAVTGEWAYPNTQGRLGDFPTQTIRVSDLVSGAKRSKARLMLGLQETSGKVAFDLSTLRIGEPAPLWPITNQNLKCEYSVKSEKRLRGVMSPSQDMTIDDFDTLQSWGATLIRYQMGRNWNAQKVTPDLDEYDRWLDTRLDHFDAFVLPQAVKRGMKVVLDMHEAPGMKNEFNEWNMLHDPAVARHFVETWRRIAKRFKGRKGIYGYDLVNEPLQTSEAAPGCDFWTLQKRAAEAVREIDPDMPIIVECNGMDSPWAYGCFSPLDMPNIIYQVHMYLPLAYTHQGVMWKQGEPRAYPDEAKGWNKEYLRAGLRPVREFQLRHDAKIFCGEFSAIVWAPGAGEYLRDCIDIFEEYGWDWCYHAFREWEGWSVEREGPNRRELVPSADNPRKRALLKGLRAK